MRIRIHIPAQDSVFLLSVFRIRIRIRLKTTGHGQHLFAGESGTTVE